MELNHPESVLFRLQQALLEDQRGAALISERDLRRAIKIVRGVSPLQLRPSSLRGLVVTRETLSAGSLDDLLPDAIRTDPPQQIHLLVRPGVEALASQTEGELLWEVWRRLFASHVTAAYQQMLATGALTPEMLAARLRRIGTTEVDEVRQILRSEGLLLPPENECDLFIAFATHYAELRFFEPRLVEVDFPALDQLHQLETILAQDLDLAALHARTRLPGASAPKSAARHPNLAPLLSEKRRKELLSSAQDQREKGDRIGAAISLRLASGAASPDTLPSDVRDDCRWLSESLADLLQLNGEGISPALYRLFLACRDALDPHARVLIDLQRGVLDAAKQVQTIDLIEWALSLGRRPVRRQLPAHNLLRLQRHMRSAVKKLPLLRLDPEHYELVAGTTHRLAQGADDLLRRTFRPELHAAFAEVGLAPNSRVERCALTSTVERLLDELLQRGFLNFSLVRDALSRSAIKLPDLGTFRQLFTGDALLRLDRSLALRLDGVYRRGEIYLRLLQRLSSLFFATNVGRWLVRYLILPLGGGFIILEGLQYLLNLVGKLFHADKIALTRPSALAATALLLLGLLHWPAFRSSLQRGLRAFGHALRWALWDVPLRFFRLPAVQRLWRSTPVLLVRRFVLLPVLLAVIPWALLSLFVRSTTPNLVAATLLFLLGNLAANSRTGRRYLDAVTEWLLRTGRRLRHHIIPGMLRWILDTFRQAMLALERLLYWVDSKLRFTQGDRSWTIPLKALFGILWFFVTYVVRIYVTLLIEPQINPIKHFPVVTVSHKLILPFTLTLTAIASRPLSPLGPVLANTIAATTVVLLPGIFGFLVWELKENWRIYAANRPASLFPPIVGSHGETMVALLRPGFHSGTLPKLFAKLRRAERRAITRDKHYQRRKLRETRHHHGDAITRFVEREMLRLLHETTDWRAPTPHVASVRLSPARVRIELGRGTAGETHWIALHESAGVLNARIERVGWVAQLSEAERRIWHLALLGLYKHCAVDLVHEQLSQLFPMCDFAVMQRALLVWPCANPYGVVRYPLEAVRILRPTDVSDRSASWPELDAAQVLLGHSGMPWKAWRDCWETGSPLPSPFDSWSVLPAVDESEEALYSGACSATTTEST